MRWVWYLWITLCFCWGWPLHGQTEPSAPPPSATGDPTILQPGDKVLVQVWGEEVAEPVFQISPTGQLLLTPYFIGSVQAAGKTLDQLQKEILQRLKEFYRNPRLSIAVVEYSPRRSLVYVFGEVNTPGAYTIGWGATVLEAIGQAGGLKPSADPRNASLVRAGGSIITLDLDRLIRQGDQRQNVQLQPGDTIVVPEGKVTVLGAVVTPGEFPVIANMKVLDLVRLAQGLQPNAEATRARIVRQDGSVTNLDLLALLADGAIQHNLPLEAGDLLFVPVAKAETGILVLGEVKQPGTFPYRTGMHLLEALMMCGGYAEGVVSAAGTISRQGQTMKVDVDALLRGGDISQNVPLEPGDVIYLSSSERRVLLLGEIERPGLYPLAPKATLIQVLALAGSFSVRADRTDVQIVRGQERLHADLEKILKEGDLTQDHPIKPGDIVLVPRRDVWQVVVLGYVKQPGLYVWQEDETLQMALAAAGGLQSTGQYRAVVTRKDGTKQEADLTALYLHGDLAQDLPLQRGDVVLVEPAGEWVWVLGRVATPGRHLLQPDETVLEALSLAGGTLASGLATPIEPTTVVPPAERLDAIVTRAGQPIRVDLHALIHEGKLSENIPIQGGDLIIVRSQGAEITVVGAVSRPGVHPYQDREKLLTAITLAGGLLPEADWSAVSVVRDQQKLAVNLNKLLQEGDPSQNLDLSPGDVVIIPEAKRVVIYGEVAAPGSYPLERRQLLMDLITAAGGRTERADLARITVHREAEILTCDLYKMQEEGDASDNIALQSGDRVFVPPRDEVLVFGAAAKPGFYPLTPDLDLLRLVTQAGYGPTTNLREVAIVRLPGKEIQAGAEVEPLYVDVKRMVDEGDLTGNIPLQAGDIVYLPEKGQKGRFDVRQIFGLFWGADALFRFLDRL